jgi:F-type H+-transporting ATPase subunit delta
MTDVPDFAKLMGTPTISEQEKLSLVEDVFSGKTSGNVYNFLRLLTVNERMGSFPQITRAFKTMYNNRFDIAEITVTSSLPLTDELRGKISAKMEKITGKLVSVTEKVDKSIIGGVMIDYGNTRYDGSVKTRLAELKKEISGIIA